VVSDQSRGSSNEGPKTGVSRRLGFLLGAGVVAVVAGVWLVSASVPSWASSLSTALRERRGQEVYNANCASCHGGPTGGRIDDYPPPHNANGHTWHHPDCALVRVTRDGSSGTPEYTPPGAIPMQGFKDKLSPADIEAVIAYIKTMWTPAQRQAQASFTKDMCFE
jgi:mono/diheme cytochrome c family protein